MLSNVKTGQNLPKQYVRVKALKTLPFSSWYAENVSGPYLTHLYDKLLQAPVEKQSISKNIFSNLLHSA